MKHLLGHKGLKFAALLILIALPVTLIAAAAASLTTPTPSHDAILACLHGLASPGAAFTAPEARTCAPTLPVFPSDFVHASTQVPHMFFVVAPDGRTALVTSS